MLRPLAAARNRRARHNSHAPPIAPLAHPIHTTYTTGSIQSLSIQSSTLRASLDERLGDGADADAGGHLIRAVGGHERPRLAFPIAASLPARTSAAQMVRLSRVQQQHVSKRWLVAGAEAAAACSRGCFWSPVDPPAAANTAPGVTPTASASACRMRPPRAHPTTPLLQHPHLSSYRTHPSHPSTYTRPRPRNCPRPPSCAPNPRPPPQGSSVPIAIPSLPRWKDGAAGAGGAREAPATFVPPHKLTHQEDFSFSFTGASPSAGLKRERLRARNAILRSTGFLEPKDGDGDAAAGGDAGGEGESGGGRGGPAAAGGEGEGGKAAAARGAGGASAHALPAGGLSSGLVRFEQRQVQQVEVEVEPPAAGGSSSSLTAALTTIGEAA